MVFRACNYLFQARLTEAEDDKFDDNNNNEMFYAFQMNDN